MLIITITTTFGLTTVAARHRKMTTWWISFVVVIGVVSSHTSARLLDVAKDVALEGNDETAIKETPSTPAGIRYFVGIGYNMITGNPEGGDLSGGVDPGLLTNRHILNLTYDKQIISKDQFLLPDQVLYTIRESQDNTQETFHGTKSYAEKVQSDITESHGVEGMFSKVKFSGSTRYSAVDASVDAYRYVYYEERELNLYAEARYRLDLADSEKWPLDEEFVASSCARLEPTYDETKYMQFIDLWGTHFVTEVNLGSKSTTRYEETTEGFVQYAHSEVSNSVSFQADLIPGFKGGVVVDMVQFDANLQAGMTFGSITHTFTAGGEEYPEPIGMGLSGMHEIFNIAYWRRFTQYVDNDRCDQEWIVSLDVIADNMEIALNGYAEWKNAQESKDPVVGMPITWPKGTYGLPMPLVGCPNTIFTWGEGWRYYDTENSFSDNLWSSPCHLQGPYWKDDMYSNFCMKTRIEEDIYDWPFQPGAYCVYKKGSCPAGLDEGWVYWDDEDTSNDNNIGGEIPDGKYDSNTEIRYCCRTDGYASNPIYLPTDNSFFLLKYTHQCQEVFGMKVTHEYFHWDTADVFNDDATGGEHPYPGVGDDILLEYCYYEPEP